VFGRATAAIAVAALLASAAANEVYATPRRAHQRHSRPATLMPTTCGLPPLTQHPSTFSFSCDGNVVFKQVHWQGWGGRTATGSGDLYLIGNECIPDCASAPFYVYPVRVVASQIARCGKRRVYGLVTAYLSEPDYRGERELSQRLGSCVL
jgi:hypothetical protein